MVETLEVDIMLTFYHGDWHYGLYNLQLRRHRTHELTSRARRHICLQPSSAVEFWRVVSYEVSSRIVILPAIP